MNTNENKKYFKDLYENEDPTVLFNLKKLELKVQKTRNIKEPIRILQINRYDHVKEITFCTESAYILMKAKKHLG